MMRVYIWVHVALFTHPKCRVGLAFISPHPLPASHLPPPLTFLPYYRYSLAKTHTTRRLPTYFSFLINPSPELHSPPRSRRSSFLSSSPQRTCLRTTFPTTTRGQIPTESPTFLTVHQNSFSSSSLSSPSIHLLLSFTTARCRCESPPETLPIWPSSRHCH